MAHVSDILEREVATLRALREPCPDPGGHVRRNARIDRHFDALLRLIAPRVRHFTRAYGLLDHAEDARQACAIGLLRAIEVYDPARASFTTLLNWQLRGELQALRFRLRDDHRESARRVRARTLSLDALLAEEGEGDWARDDASLDRAEMAASDALARRACGCLLARWRQQRQDREPAERIDSESRIAEAWLIGDEDDRVAAARAAGLTSEQGRQIARRAIRNLAGLVAAAGVEVRATRH